MEKCLCDVNEGDKIQIDEVFYTVYSMINVGGIIHLGLDPDGKLRYEAPRYQVVEVIVPTLKEKYGAGPFPAYLGNSSDPNWGRGTGNYVLGDKVDKPEPFTPYIAITDPYVDLGRITVNIVEFNELGQYRFTVSISSYDSNQWESFSYNVDARDVEYYTLAYPRS